MALVQETADGDAQGHAGTPVSNRHYGLVYALLEPLGKHGHTWLRSRVKGLVGLMHPHPALRADLSRGAGEVYQRRIA